MTKFAGWMGPVSDTESAVATLAQTAGELPVVQCAGRGYAVATDSANYKQASGVLLVALQSAYPTDALSSLLEAYLQRGIEALRRQPGIVNLLLIDERQQTTFLMTDPIGISHIYYAKTNDALVFGSSADFVVRHPQVSNAISPQSVFDYLYFNYCPSPNTIYRQVMKLEGGQCLSFHGGKVAIDRYWQPDFFENDCDLRQSGRQLQQYLVEAVRDRVADDENTGAFLSGGLDSSSVAGALARVFPGKAKTFSMGFQVAGYDEIEYANIAVAAFKTRSHTYYVTPEDTVAAVPAIAAYYDEPFGNSSALAAYYCAKLAKDNGVNRLLAGDGGDEIFAGNERYAKQMLFEGYHRLPQFLTRGMEYVLDGLPDAIARQKIPFKAKRYIEQAKAAMPDRLQDYNFLHRHAAADIFQADFLTEVDISAPMQSLRENYWRPANASTLNRMLYMDWKSTLHDNDLVKVNRMCEMAGVEVCYPLLDPRIVDLSCRIPSADKLRGQKLRWFYKQAMADFLPEAIINKSKHGFGLPFGIWLKDHEPLKQMAYQAVRDLGRRDFFRPEFLEHAIKMHQSVHAAYYGELIWVLMMLELWFVGKGY
ncbi:asparagine synthase C-terminal domain-containing protein [Methylomonas sp. EFPC3]|uniref:asparagine synthetase B family protein n=1 Tax=Methylomonas sp. EFPC3 TaxID=3021710 RepID=UPI0024169228|nr:asparagine synthase C-terminal domain-containing protein [Methylomonas sp. EFPC3]WFP50727.1 asparagine synthase C-terminal domain-containing protein [Methylomonas sp. EFPC3]